VAFEHVMVVGKEKSVSEHTTCMSNLEADGL